MLCAPASRPLLSSRLLSLRNFRGRSREGVTVAIRAGMRILPAVAALFLLAGSFVAPASAADEEETYRRRRFEMVKEVIAPEGITNEKVLDSMRMVPRHLFVTGALKERAYFDVALAIGHKQTISPPFIVAYMTQILDPQPTDRVLEIGTGSGYQAAILSGIVKEVFTIEIVEPLGEAAAKRLQELGYRNVQVKVGDGYQGWPEHAPFDKIIVTCSPESVPQPLVDQLKEGGRMIIPLGERYQQVFYLFEKRDGKLEKTELIPALFVPMTGISEENRKVRPDPLNPTLVNGSFEDVGRDENHPDGWHYQRLLQVSTGRAPSGEKYVTFTNADAGRTAQCVQGMPVDGRKLAALRVSLWIRGTQLRSGKQPWEKPALVVHYFDADRRHIGEAHLGPWAGSFGWNRVSGDLAIPYAAREAILHVGLNGGTGELSIDDVRVTPQPRGR